MKTKIASILLVASLIFLSACSSLTNSNQVGTKVQTVLSNLLPPDFVGDVHLDHNNPYFDFAVDVVNIRKNTDGKWTWDSLVYERKDFFHTSGGIRLTPTKVAK